MVDGIGSPSVTMISTVSIEPANLANADLSWKTVTKGFRSATRRPRKINQSLNMGLQHNDVVSKDEPSVAESEEFGVAVLGHRFSEKIDHLPIKKRRPLQKSLPLPTRLPIDLLCRVSGQEAGILDDLVPVWTSSRREKSVVNKKPPCCDDSYGIELLAAAACNTSINNEVLNVKAVKLGEKNAVLQSDASVDASLLEETIKCWQKKSSPLIDIKTEAHHDSKEQNSSPVVSGDIHDKNDVAAEKDTSSGKDVRLHWDLNTVMDEWELFPENMNTNFSRNVLVDVGCEGLRSGETEKLEGNGRHRNHEHAWKLLKCLSEVASAHVSGKSNSGLSPETDPISTESSLKEKMNLITTRKIAEVEENDCQNSDLNLDQTLAAENVQFVKQDIAMVDRTISETGTCDVVKKKLFEDKFSKLPNGRNNIILTGTTMDAEDHISKSVQAGPSFDKGRDLANRRDINVPSTVGPPVGSSSEIEVKKLEFKFSERLDEVALEDLLDDGDVSDNSPSSHHHLVRIRKLSKYQSGWESPVEDGELRESFAHSWQQNEDELDCVDYDMDDRDAVDGFGVGNHCVPEAVSGSNQIESNGKLVEKVTFGKNDPSKESSHSVSTGNSSGRDRIPEGRERSANFFKANNVKLGGEVCAFDPTEKFNVNGSLKEKVGQRVTKGNFSIHLQGSSGSGAFGGKVTRDVQRSSGTCFQDRQVYRSNKYFERDRPFPRMQDGRQKNNQDGDVLGDWDSRNHYQNGYRRGGGNPRLSRNNIPDANDDELVCDDQRHFRINYPRDWYCPFVRRRSPDDNHNSMNGGNFVIRDDNHYRGRGRSGFYRRGFVKGNRDEFHDPIVDNRAPSPVWVPRNHSARRQCSTSPVYNRENSFSRPGRKSRSRSRSRSHVPWNLQKGRDFGERRSSRSPDFRSGGRIGRNRMHYSSKNLDNDNRHLSPPRRRFFDDRNTGPPRFRERTSPGRFFGQRPRFDSNGTGGRMKTDDGGFRPRINSERFSEQSGGGWRGYNNNHNHNYNYDGSDNERTRYNNKHEMIRRVRLSETGGAARRFRSDADECFKDHCIRDEYSNNNSSCSRSTEKSDALGKSCEGERGHLKNDSDKTHTTSSKLPGVRNSEDDASISRG